MKALTFSEQAGLVFAADRITPTPQPSEALIKIIRAGVCSTDLEILKGYVPGYDHVLGHEFVGRVTDCSSKPEIVGSRVVGEINCRCDANWTHPDPVFVRNHAPARTVLGIIAKDGTMAEYCTLPTENLHFVPDSISDQEACFAEPLAAACRIVEQKLVSGTDRVAVIGDGKLGLLVAQLLVVKGLTSVTHIGRHQRKLDLVQGTAKRLVGEDTAAQLSQAFDVAIEASGSSGGIKLALAITCAMGTVVLKSTCSVVNDGNMPEWSALANDIVVNEKQLIGSRCGPFEPALEALQDPRVAKLVNSMVDGVYEIDDGIAAIEKAQTKGVLKVQLQM